MLQFSAKYMLQAETDIDKQLRAVWENAFLLFL